MKCLKHKRQTERSGSLPLLLYIGGYGRSGSTLVDCFLSSTPLLVGVGEASRFFSEIRNGGFCACGKAIPSCDFWGPFVSRYTTSDLLSLEIITSRVEGCWRYSTPTDLVEYRRFWSNLFEYVSQGGALGVVDSSKTTRYTVKRFSNIAPIFQSSVFVFLYKSPADLLVSLRKGSNTHLSGKEGRPYSKRFFLRSLCGWFVGCLGAVRAAFRSDGGVIIANYRDFCESPHLLLDSISALGVSLEVDAPSHLSPGHGIAGNRMRRRILGVSKPTKVEYDFSLIERGAIMLMDVVLMGFLWFLKKTKPPSRIRNVGDAAEI